MVPKRQQLLNQDETPPLEEEVPPEVEVVEANKAPVVVAKMLDVEEEAVPPQPGQ